MEGTSDLPDDVEILKQIVLEQRARVLFENSVYHAAAR
jgi:hypothetical protein